MRTIRQFLTPGAGQLNCWNAGSRIDVSERGGVFGVCLINLEGKVTLHYSLTSTGYPCLLGLNPSH